MYSLDEACARLPDSSPVLYLGWLHASHVKGYRAAARRFAVCAVCGVGLCDTGTLVSEVRKATAIAEDIPLFTLQGGIDRTGLKGIDKLMIAMLARALAAQKQRTAQDERMLELLSKDASYVCPENLAAVLQCTRRSCIDGNNPVWADSPECAVKGGKHDDRNGKTCAQRIHHE